MLSCPSYSGRISFAAIGGWRAHSFPDRVTCYTLSEAIAHGKQAGIGTYSRRRGSDRTRGASALPSTKGKATPSGDATASGMNECTLKAYQDYLKDQASRPTDVENCFRWKAPLRSDDCKNAFVFSSSSV